ncbi:MAG: lipopolysaccharide biosynthesis protein [Ferrovibrio sp.]|uniref:lipopolysaccharide biosynthesis protein n=1 Tax=Ferrovibrio sp. TaxID=1917215 RepID=UPI00260F0D26|nr:lipopolysaccharide biosynthesis protein [Ferrovibrio sp.]MCW0232838.1 lipopolysaccharide biosynthesis protein [Ferrovibrio sp.]
MTHEGSEGQSVVRGAWLAMAMRWVDRLVGIASTLILARLLAPEDFGVIAMAMLVIGLVEVLSDLGVNIAIVREREPGAVFLDTAWTLRLLQNALVGVTLFAVAPLAADYFNDVRVAPVLQVLSIAFFISGFENIGIVALQKDMRFSEEFRFLAARRLAGFIVTVTAAYAIGSYWALVIGYIASRLLGTALSYVLHPMRPGFSLKAWRSLLGISKWLMLRSVGEFLVNNLHRLVIGRLFPASTVGYYTLANEISLMPGAEFLAPMNRALFPAFSKIQDDATALRRLFMRAQSIQYLLALPIAAGMVMTAPEAVAVLLGEKWMRAAPLLEVLVIGASLLALSSCSGYVLLVRGKYRHIALLTWAQLALFVLALFALMPSVVTASASSALSPELAPDAVALARTIAAAVGLVLNALVLRHAAPMIRWSDVCAGVVRPALGVAMMVTALSLLTLPATLPPVLVLLAKAALGAWIYSAGVVVLWLLSGRPDGAETWLLGQLRSRLARADGARR